MVDMSLVFQIHVHVCTLGVMESNQCVLLTFDTECIYKVEHVQKNVSVHILPTRAYHLLTIACVDDDNLLMIAIVDACIMCIALYFNMNNKYL